MHTAKHGISSQSGQATCQGPAWLKVQPSSIMSQCWHPTTCHLPPLLLNQSITCLPTVGNEPCAHQGARDQQAVATVFLSHAVRRWRACADAGLNWSSAHSGSADSRALHKKLIVRVPDAQLLGPHLPQQPQPMPPCQPLCIILQHLQHMLPLDVHIARLHILCL